MISNSIKNVKVEWCVSDNGDFCTRSNPLPTVPCTPYLLLDQLVSGLLGLDGRYVVNKVNNNYQSPLRGPLYRCTPWAVLGYR
jgi:hypothetical protein